MIFCPPNAPSDSQSALIAQVYQDTEERLWNFLSALEAHRGE
jgi:hypothetical protein